MDNTKSSQWSQGKVPVPEPVPPPAMPPFPMDTELNLPANASSPAFMPTFMKAIEAISNAIPAILIEAKNSTFVDNVLKNKQLRNHMFQLALMLSSSAAELIDRKASPRAYNLVKFVRNVLALEKLRQQVADKFVVRGGSNMDDWDVIRTSVVRVSSGVLGKDVIKYIPPGLTDANTFITALGCSVANPNTYYAMYKCDADHAKIELNVTSNRFGFMDGWYTGSRRKYTVESLFRYGPDMQLVTEGNGSIRFILAKASSTFFWLQVFKFTSQRKDYINGDTGEPFYAIMYTPCYSPKENTETVEVNNNNFLQLVVIGKKTGVVDVSSLDSFIERKRSAASAIVQSFLKKMKFSMFNPETTVIAMSNIFGAEDSNNTNFFARITTYSGKDAVHVLPEYDTIRDALGKCLDMGKSRGYAFVGAPGTGKTIMMNQLINEFPENPVVKFSMQGFDSTGPNRSELLSSILDVVQSLSDAGFSKVFLCCDDIDSVDMSTKNVSVENLISLLDGLHTRLQDSTSIVFMCTVNDPTKMHSTIIKRGKRIDEVIEVPCPDAGTIRRLINSLKDKEDPTDYTVPQFSSAIERMANDRFSLADLSTMMTNLQIYGEPDESGKFTPETLDTAIGRIELSKANAAKTYEV